MLKSKEFSDKKFYYCYDCGWGEKGVHEYNISYEQAEKIIIDRAGIEIAAEWKENQYNYFEFRNNYYMLSESWFDPEEWEGSEDY